MFGIRDYPDPSKIIAISLKKFLLWGILLSAIFHFTADSIPAEEYSFDLNEIEKKPYHLAGYVEINPVLFGLDCDTRLFRLRLYNCDEDATTEQYNGTLQLEGSYEKGLSRLFVRTNSSLIHTYEGWSGKTDLHEGYLSLKPSSIITLDAGKKTMKWGKGYAWNPVAFIDRPKNPDDPDLNLEGFFMASMDYIRSFEGILKTFSFSPALVPVYGGMNEDFGEARHLNLAARFYLLFLDTDLDFMFLSGGSRSHRYGFDFSRNITSNLEIHGEVARYRDEEKISVDRSGVLYSSQSDTWSYLLGLRYLSARDTTYILEYYHNGAGFTEKGMEDYFLFIDKGYDSYLSTGREDMIRKAQKLNATGYGGMNPMRNYLYIRISQKEPFEILYFTPALSWICNMDDQSFQLAPELVYTGFTNLELRLKGAILAGDAFSEYGERQNDYRIEFRLRYYF